MSKNSSRARPEIPQPDYNDPKEVFAFFGLAAYCAQLLQQGITNLLVGLQILGKQKLTWIHVRNLYDNADRGTLGILLRSVRELSAFDSKLDDELAEALKNRNYLMHQFFVDHSTSLLSVSGKRKMIDELQNIIAVFKSVDQKVDELWLSIWGKYGFTKELIEQELRAVKQALKRGWQNS